MSRLAVTVPGWLTVDLEVAGLKIHDPDLGHIETRINHLFGLSVEREGGVRNLDDQPSVPRPRVGVRLPAVGDDGGVGPRLTRVAERQRAAGRSVSCR